MPKLHAILRIEKRYRGNIAKIGNHHERMKESYKSNPDINRERSSLNYHLKKPTGTYTQMVNAKIANVKRVRKDSVLLADTFIGGSPEFINGLSSDEQKEFFKRGYDFMARNIGEHNILSAVVHLDEKTPHMHLVFTPITDDNRLCAKEMLGNPKRFEKWQDDFYACMHSRFDCLDRGDKASETGRKHIPVWLYKQSARLNDEVDELRDMLSDLSLMNVGKRKKEVIALLEKWYKGANSFNGQVKSLVSQNKAMQEQNAELVQKLKDASDNFTERITEKDNFIYEHMRDYSDLVERYNDNIAFIDCIPDGLFKQLRRQFNAQRELENGYEREDD